MKNTIPLYRTVLAQAWQITRERKTLWFWGLFAALLGNIGEYQFLSAAVNRAILGNTSSVILNFPAPPLSFSQGLLKTATTDPFSVFILLLIGLLGAVLVAFFVWLATVAVIGLIAGAGGRGSKQPFLKEIGSTVSESKASFAPVLITYVFGRILLWLIMGLVALFGALVFVDMYVGLPLFIVAFLVLVPLLFLISFAIRFAIMFIVLKKKSILESIQLGSSLVRQHWIVAAELALLLLCINIVTALFLLAFIYLGVLPFLITATIFWKVGLTTWAVMLTVLAVLSFLVAVFIFGSLLTTFQWAAWTILFVRLQQRARVFSKVTRMLGHLITDRPLRLFSKS
ncbi:MAG: hypothetical protein WC817_01890 [Patescibacteria group bacterium]|jgi:hypothetical protein